MSTTYRVVVRCDGLPTADCHGVLELSTPELHRIAQHSDIEAKGWLRGYTRDQTYDLCPVCKRLLEAEQRATKRAKAKEPQP